MVKVPKEIYAEVERRFKSVKPWSEAYCELYSMQNFLWWLDMELVEETKPTEDKTNWCNWIEYLEKYQEKYAKDRLLTPFEREEVVKQYEAYLKAMDKWVEEKIELLEEYNGSPYAPIITKHLEALTHAVNKLILLSNK